MSVADSNQYAERDLGFLTYDIPLNCLIYIKLNKTWYANASLGLSAVYKPSTIGGVNNLEGSHTFIHTGYVDYKKKFTADFNGNIGFEFRSKNSGFFYLGGAVQIPLEPLFYLAGMYKYQGYEITDIDINDVTGEVFIATKNGLVSFRSPATEGTSKHQSVKIFPNPVESDFEGLVGITGVVDQAIIKITDISGQLVWQARANGGTLGWNVRDINNNRVSTGMYFVFSSSDDGEEFFIGKIAIVD